MLSNMTAVLRDPAHHQANRRILTSFHRQQAEQAQVKSDAATAGSPVRSAGARSLLDGPSAILRGIGVAKKRAAPIMAAKARPWSRA